ncbi:DUF192 domain-containing protein [uncultured Thiohalocapsa sp.]|uniref:DUF192 domain-containing protein n=1 Tax=uncultured Thiohalocapsa sp. TaxID=768990 RepID=UPI0025D8651B|nr:DUF192 domain-containing protein [uncultured Thiohalocapsa sp.]
MTRGPSPAAIILAAALLALTLAQASAEGVIRPDATVSFLSTEGRVLARIQAEIADDPAAHARGLMWRRLPDDTVGMLFVFPRAAPRRFWMCNTPGSLDMLFADAERRIVAIARDTTLMSDQRYPSGAPAMYVIDTRAGFAERHGITPGTSFDYTPAPAP